MRRALIVSAFALAACGAQPAATVTNQTTAAAAAPAASAPAVAPWFICDGVSTPALFELERAGSVVRVAEYAKPSGAIANRSEFDLGEGDGAAGHVYHPFQRDGQDAGFARETNPGVLEHQGIAYTPVITELKLGDRDVSCRWMPRTRLMGFTGRRSFVVTEDASGDLIYDAYAFADAANAKPVELSDNANTTTFTLEVRDGHEQIAPDHTEYRFEHQGYTYVITANNNQTGTLAVLHGGQQVQSEPITAFQTGNGPS
jgi:hypothetical protein